MEVQKNINFSKHYQRKEYDTISNQKKTNQNVQFSISLIKSIIDISFFCYNTELSIGTKLVSVIVS